MDQWMDGWIDQMIYESIYRWTFQRHPSPHVLVPPQLTLFTSPTAPSTPRHIRGRKFSTLEIWQSPDKFTGKRTSHIYVYVYILPSLADELLHSKEDEDTSGTANTDHKQRQAALTISFRGRKVLLSVKSVVSGGGQRRWGRGGGGQSIDPSIHRSFDRSIHPLIHPFIHPFIHSSIIQSIYPLIYLSIDRSINALIDWLMDRSING